MNDNGSYILTAVVPALFGLCGALVGGYITYRVYEKVRKRKSIYDIADIFGQEARNWTHKKFESGNPEFIKWHNESVDHLSANVGYLDRNHKKICANIWPDWVAFHGGDAGKAIDHNSYWGPEGKREKDFWINHLYRIADILRDS